MLFKDAFCISPANPPCHLPLKQKVGLVCLYALFLSFVPKKREKNLRFLRITYSQPTLV